MDQYDVINFLKSPGGGESKKVLEKFSKNVKKSEEIRNKKNTIIFGKFFEEMLKES